MGKIAEDVVRGRRTGELSMSSIAGATKYRTRSSTKRYFAFPFTTCFPGAPVRGPPGIADCRVPERRDSAHWYRQFHWTRK